jgi:hypothetical protein
MTDKPKVYFTREEELVHLQTNPHFCVEGEVPLEIKIDQDGEFRGLSYGTLWDAGAGIIESSPKGKWNITEISDTQDDHIFSFETHIDDCIWSSYWDDLPSTRYAFVKDYETSQANSHIGPDHENYVIVNNNLAIKVGVHNRRPIKQVFDFELGVWVEDHHWVYCLLNNEVYSDDPWDLPGWGDINNDLKWVPKEEVETYIAKEQKESHLKITDFSVPTPTPLPLPVDTYLAGSFAYEVEKVRDLLSPGDRLKLRLEPTNRFDPWAIEVFTMADIKLGYVPSDVNKPYVEIMDEGYEILAEIMAVDPDRDGDIEIRLSPGRAPDNSA